MDKPREVVIEEFPKPWRDSKKYRDVYLYEYLGELLKSCRKENGWTLEEAANHLTTSKSQVHELENAVNTQPRLPMLKKLSEVYNIDPRELLKY